MSEVGSTELVPVGTYVRDLGASLERLFENALDWEHLPHVHGDSFSSIRLIEANDEGWRAEAMLDHGRQILLDLTLDREAGRWITRTLIEGSLASEIVSDAIATGEHSCRVSVAFAADVAAQSREAVADHYRRLYEQLYDEDERLMIARAEAVRRGPKALKERRHVTLADGSAHPVPVYCPHQGLPLDTEPDADGVLTCPWHGYRFDVRSGRCVSGQSCAWTAGEAISRPETRPRD